MDSPSTSHDDGGPAAAPAPRPCTVRVRNRRNILCVSPRYAPSFGTFQHSYKLLPGVSAFMPPQGLLVIAAYLPREWQVRFIDENKARASDADFAWADAVFISGMHVQRQAINGINARAHVHGKLTVLGGPSVSAFPDYYPDIDILHMGELGDATNAVIAHIDGSPRRPARQLVFTTDARLPLEEFPLPAYDQIKLGDYFLGSIQFSSGCPFRCEFCDIPALYGRNPRLKSPEQILRELDALLASGARGTIYFVDDNFVANKKAAHALLPHLIRWQRDRGYPIHFACEATLNLAQMPDLLAMMREADFRTVFVGIETPEAVALAAMEKRQNLRLPILEAVEILNRHGLEVVSGMILGLDTDTPRTGPALKTFIDLSRIPLLTINLLYALPRTPLYDRLRLAGRLLSDDAAAARVSNVDFLLPYAQVVGMWRDVVTTAYAPARLFDRFRHQLQYTFANRIARRPKPTWSSALFGFRVLGRVLWHAGVAAGWRREFWKLCGPLLLKGRIEDVIYVGIVSYHLITFTRAIESGKSEASFYADPSRSKWFAERRAA
ncbi:MAG: B12-binding domain-containing radical SAM protein [Dongiaceae bacterium]